MLLDSINNGTEFHEFIIDGMMGQIQKLRGLVVNLNKLGLQYHFIGSVVVISHIKFFTL